MSGKIAYLIDFWTNLFPFELDVSIYSKIEDDSERAVIMLLKTLVRVFHGILQDKNKHISKDFIYDEIMDNYSKCDTSNLLSFKPDEKSHKSKQRTYMKRRRNHKYDRNACNSTKTDSVLPDSLNNQQSIIDENIMGNTNDCHSNLTGIAEKNSRTSVSFESFHSDSIEPSFYSNLVESSFQLDSIKTSIQSDLIKKNSSFDSIETSVQSDAIEASSYLDSFENLVETSPVLVSCCQISSFFDNYYVSSNSLCDSQLVCSDHQLQMLPSSSNLMNVRCGKSCLEKISPKHSFKADCNKLDKADVLRHKCTKDFDTDTTDFSECVATSSLSTSIPSLLTCASLYFPLSSFVSTSSTVISNTCVTTISSDLSKIISTPFVSIASDTFPTSDLESNKRISACPNDYNGRLCNNCALFYSNQALSKQKIQDLVKKCCSRKKNSITNTPPDFWDPVDFTLAQ